MTMSRNVNLWRETCPDDEHRFAYDDVYLWTYRMCIRCGLTEHDPPPPTRKERRRSDQQAEAARKGVKT